jgi:hypothetical protein
LFADADVEALSAFGKAVRSYYDVSLSLPATFNVIELRKDIKSCQQVESFAVDALIMVRGPSCPRTAGAAGSAARRHHDRLPARFTAGRADRGHRRTPPYPLRPSQGRRDPAHALRPDIDLISDIGGIIPVRGNADRRSRE